MSQHVSYRLLSDQLGSPRVVINRGTGATVAELRYDEFGREVQNSAPNLKLPMGFAGGLYDPDTKLVRFGARDYDPEVGRWLSKDPILFAAGDSNLYGYVASDPVNAIDPTGLYQVCTRPLSGFGSEMGPVYHQYLCANGVCGGQAPSGSGWGSPGTDSNDGAPGSTGVSCKEGPNDNEDCMDKCIAGAIGGPRPYYRWHGAGGTNCKEWANDTVARCAAQCRGK